MAFPTAMRRTVSQMPIGRTPGFLSRGTSRHAMKGARAAGSTYGVAIRQANCATELQRSRDPEAPRKAIKSCCTGCHGFCLARSWFRHDGVRENTLCVRVFLLQDIEHGLLGAFWALVQGKDSSRRRVGQRTKSQELHLLFLASSGGRKCALTPHWCHGLTVCSAGCVAEPFLPGQER